jgi:hypothetical protein
MPKISNQTNQTLDHKIDSLEQLLAAEVFAEDAFRTAQTQREQLAQELGAATDVEKRASKHRKQTADAVTKAKMKLPVAPAGVRYPTYESVEARIRSGEFVVVPAVAETGGEPSAQTSLGANADDASKNETLSDLDDDEGLSTISAPTISAENDLFAAPTAAASRTTVQRQLTAVR